MTYKQALRKRKIETALARPIVWLGKILSRFFIRSRNHQLVIFAPSADIGGANVINADIANVLANLKPLVIISKIPRNNQLLHLFQRPGITVWDISEKIDHKWYHFVNIFYRGVIAQWINSTKGIAVIGGESLYFHKVFPWLKKGVRTIELSHLDTWFNYTQQFVSDIDVRVFSTNHLKRSAEKFYDQQGIPAILKERMQVIDTMIEIPEPEKPGGNNKLEVVFIGRGSPQKRVYLIAAVAKKSHEKQLPVHFSFVGDVSAAIDDKEMPYCKFYGNISDRNTLQEIQRRSDVLLLTSAFEGLPVVVVEMMALGKAIVATAVNAIPDYIRDGVNGFLIPDHNDERQIVDDALIALSILSADRELLKEMGIKNYQEAREKFGKDLFAARWIELTKPH